MKRNVVLALMAHVDAGKTTLAEALLYQSGVLRKLGRVDHGDTTLDTHELERRRGITIFSSQAAFVAGDLQVTLLDTPGHVDFSAETERTLSVLDYAILVISGTDGVQAHTRTLWRLLECYHVPTLIFVTKMDFARYTKEEIMARLRHDLSDNCVDFSADMLSQREESIAMSREDLLEDYLATGTVSDTATAEVIAARQIFPCWFGSGLKLDGVEPFLQDLQRYTVTPTYPETFGARVFKISRDAQGKRLVHLKVTGGTLRVRDSVRSGEKEEKVSQMRLYSGDRFEPLDAMPAGGVCTVLGLDSVSAGEGLGFEASAAKPILEPVMHYRVVLPDGCDARTALPKLKQLEEEDPLLQITWDAHLQEIHVGLMGEVQTEILKSIIARRFGMEVSIDQGRVLYKETITDTVEGVGHYEPLRHYAEVHLLLEPLPLGSGMQWGSNCSEDVLDRNWQRLIMTHLQEKQHLGVLTGSPITDVKITLCAGRAHIKHTEGGDFRQATYRAVRQGLMQAQSELLEPYYAFRLEVPAEQLGRAINDLRARHGAFEVPEGDGVVSVLTGTVPVTAMEGYAAEVAAYTGGRGRLSCVFDRYGECHNPQQVIEQFGYEPERDVENTPDSVFCAHGGGFTVAWDKVPEYMHLESCLKKDTPYVPQINRRNLRLDDKELEAIMEREFGPISRRQYRAPQVNAAQREVVLPPRRKYLIVDGYNVIFAWQSLKELAKEDIGAAREHLISMLCNYAAYHRCELILVFDGYKVSGGTGEKTMVHNIYVAYTKEHETADMYIERLMHDIGKNDQVTVITSDGLIQLSALHSGVLRMSAAEFEREVDAAQEEIRAMLAKMHRAGTSKIGDHL